LAKVYFTDSGSTGMEVAVKMALRASASRYGWNHSEKDIEILGLKGSYHGDTMGVMDCSEPSTYNEKVEWYSPKGRKLIPYAELPIAYLIANTDWFDFPKVHMKKGKWVVEVPPELTAELGESQAYDSLDEVFDMRVRDATKYREYITSTLVSLRDEGRRFGALILEPVILGAGGMLFA
jgi:dethiobiotin synthetase/adenosylmethionine--8-amino-7-oxononanoate aminotransferase